ncbi:pyridoxamine 5'-phosphate oxidase family protein [Methylocystis parvus]|uniref:pyridoxamine 5'-phosphate oxidase family protein n=1 Tax=Methylocystis parvus TaxID=134 RepID=UPI003C7310B7
MQNFGPRVFPNLFATESQQASISYRRTRRATLLHRAALALPYRLREPFAEKWLRRAGSPGPAAEHVLQYLRDAGQSVAKTAKGADSFYLRQYRQYLNATMGAFAATATMAALAAGGRAQGGLWRRRRPVSLAMAETHEGASPIVLLDHESVAVAAFLPRMENREEARDWLVPARTMHEAYRRHAEGARMNCAEPGIRATRRTAMGAMVELVQAARDSGKLAILALHPYDPDAMGLHITLFGVEILTPGQVEQDYALGAGALDAWRFAAKRTGASLFFLVGGVEEAFTQCSQNLFVKRPRDGGENSASRPRWTPLMTLDRLLGEQFEILQATVSASGLPGVSPRNGEYGLAGFAVRRGGKTVTLVPYFVGNAVHGHAAKLLSNPWSSLLIWDDHHWLSAVTLSGPTRIVEHSYVCARFGHVAEMLATRRARNGGPASEPEYWFEQEVAEIVIQAEAVAANWLDLARPPCSLNAGGFAHHGKKPAYFLAESLPPYDMALQHERESQGRPTDPSGVARRYWEWDSAGAFAARRAHLAELDVGSHSKGD